MDWRSLRAIGKLAPCSAAAINRCWARDLAGIENGEVKYALSRQIATGSGQDDRLF
jgi:hypothetical protein